MKFSTDKMKDLMEMMKEETPEAFESNPYEMNQEDQSEDDSSSTSTSHLTYKLHFRKASTLLSYCRF